MRTPLIFRIALLGCAVIRMTELDARELSPSSFAPSGYEAPHDPQPSLPQPLQKPRRQSPTTTEPNSAEIVAKQQSGFSAYAQRVSGQELRVFGHELFQTTPSTFAPLDSAAVNGDYVIGPGDEIQLRGWGMVDIELNLVVDRGGSIYIPRVGAVRLTGVKARDLQGYLKQAISRVFSHFELSASLAQTHALQIYVVGHAVRPGTYTLSAMSTLLNALFSSGGPSGTGSMRKIQLRRDNRVISVFDLYAMLTRGDKSHDVSLQDGDVIFIPEVGAQIALTGGVKQPAIYELQGASTLADALRWAGGFASGDEQRAIIIEKAIEYRYQTIAELPGASPDPQARLAQVDLRPADVVRVLTLGSIALPASKQREFVEVGGEVRHPGVYPIKSGETLRALISRLGGLTDRGYLFATRLTRESARREQQTRLDQIAARFSHEIETISAEKIAGASDANAVRAQGAELEQLRQLARKLQSVKADGRIVLELKSANVALENLPELPLQDGDSIFIPRKPGTVSVLGAVFQPNTFIYQDQRQLSDYLALAGGPSVSASSTETYVIRADGTVARRDHGWLVQRSDQTINPGDAIVVPEKIERAGWTQIIKDWTTILYQFGLGAAGLKILKD